MICNQIDKDFYEYDPVYTGECEFEKIVQTRCWTWLLNNEKKLIKTRLIFHPVNESKREAHYGKILKNRGLQRGIADIISLYFIVGAFELKRANKSKSRVSKEEIEHLKSVSKHHGFSAICYGFGAFKTAWADYMKKVNAYKNLIENEYI